MVSKPIVLMKKPVPDNLKYLLAIALVILAVFGRVIFFDYIHLDEDILITGNSYFYRSGLALKDIFLNNAYYPSGVTAYYRPLYVISFIADTYLGASMRVFHATNLILHTLASILVFLFIKKLLRLPEDGRENPKHNIVPLSLSLLFTVHPIVVQAVSWVPARADSLLTIFMLLSFMQFSDFLLERKNKHLAGHLVFFALALFSKETAVALPLLAVFYVSLFGYKKFFSQRGFALVVSGWAGAGLLWFLLRQNALGNIGIADARLFQMIKIVLNNFPVVLLYLSKIMLPVNLSVFPLMRDSGLIYGLISVGILAFYVAWNRFKMTKHFVFGLLWFVVFLAFAVLNYDDPSQMAFFEHRAYLPFIGFIVLLLDFVPRFKPKYIKIFIFGLIPILAFVSYSYSLNFRNASVYWRRAVKISPNSARAHLELANVYVSEKSFSDAESEYLVSLELNPKEKQVHNNLALLYVKQGQLDVAEQYLKKELKIDPGSVVANFNMGNIYARRNKFKEALFYWQKALETNPNHILTHESLIKYYYLQKNMEEMNRHINEITKMGAPLSQEINQILENK